MSYPPPQRPQRNPNPENRFMNLSAGMLMLVITAVIVLPIVGCLVCCAMGVISAPVTDDGEFDSSPSYSVPSSVSSPLPTMTTPTRAAGTTTSSAAPTTQVVEPTGTESNYAYYSSCADAKRAGAAPMYRGGPGYRSGLDRDGDGIACDK